MVTLCAALASLAGAHPTTRATSANPKPDIDLREHPTGSKTPIEVSVGMYITDLVVIDETRESFEVGGYLSAQWRDTRLALSPGAASSGSRDSGAARIFRTDQLWTPPIEAANSISHETNAYSMGVDPAGLITYIERFDAVLSNVYLLRKFPFDTQVLRFEFQPFLSPASAVTFAPQALPLTGISSGRNTELASWRAGELRYTVDEVPARGDSSDSPSFVSTCRFQASRVLSLEDISTASDDHAYSRGSFLDRRQGIRLAAQNPDGDVVVHGGLQTGHHARSAQGWLCDVSGCCLRDGFRLLLSVYR